MFLLGVLCALFVAVSSSEDYCSNIKEFCENGMEMNKNISYCSSKFGNITNLENHLQVFANTNIIYSYELLLMSSYFGSYNANREGFKALYRKLSDKAWENAITTIKFITKRGSKMNFISSIKETSDTNIFSLNEIESLVKAFQIEGRLTNQTIEIYSFAHHQHHYDPSVSYFIQEKFMEQQTNYMRLLAGYINDLKLLLMSKNPSVAVFLFDEYLKSTM